MAGSARQRESSTVQAPVETGPSHSRRSPLKGNASGHAHKRSQGGRSQEALNESLRYAVIYEQGRTSVSAYVPDLPGCVAAGDSVSEVRGLIRGAIKLHLAGLREDGQPIPEPTTRCDYVRASRVRS